MTRMRQLCALCLAALLAGEAAALQVRERSNERHSRRLAGTGEINRNFLFYDYDSSGIAISQDTLAAAGRAALISPRHFVTSSHTSGTHPNTVTFLAGDGTSRAYPVDSYRHVSGSTDLTIGTLAERIPPEHGIAHYAIARVIEPGYDSAMIGLFGMSGLAGINRLDGGTTPASEFFRHDYDVPPASLFGRGGDEAAPTMGDSGHAMVAAYAGRLFVLGVHYTTTTSQSVPRHIDAIRAIVEADGEELTVLDTMPRTIADFDPANPAFRWGDAGIFGGEEPPGSEAPAAIGRLGNTAGPHHLYALRSDSRPVLIENEGTFPFLRFDGDAALVATDRHHGGARAFQFELNTEAPRLTLVMRVPANPDGVRPLMEIVYDSSPHPFRLEYDHGRKRLRASGFEQGVEVPLRENAWVVVEWIRQREFIALAVNGAEPARSVIHTRHNADTDFSRLILGSLEKVPGGRSFDLARLIFKDTGLAPDPRLVRELLERYAIRRQLPDDSAWWPDPDGSEVLRFVVETAPQPDGPYAPLRLRAADLMEYGDGWRLALPRVNQLARHLRVNGGPALQVPTGETTLRLQLQASQAGPGAMQPVQAEDWSPVVEDGALLWRRAPAPAAARWFRLLAGE
jgi:hypothetical protein